MILLKSPGKLIVACLFATATTIVIHGNLIPGGWLREPGAAKQLELTPAQRPTELRVPLLRNVSSEKTLDYYSSLRARAVDLLAESRSSFETERPSREIRNKEVDDAIDKYRYESNRLVDWLYARFLVGIVPPRHETCQQLLDHDEYDVRVVSMLLANDLPYHSEFDPDLHGFIRHSKLIESEDQIVRVAAILNYYCHNPPSIHEPDFELLDLITAANVELPVRFAGAGLHLSLAARLARELVQDEHGKRRRYLREYDPQVVESLACPTLQELQNLQHRFPYHLDLLAKQGALKEFAGYIASDILRVRGSLRSKPFFTGRGQLWLLLGADFDARRGTIGLGEIQELYDEDDVSTYRVPRDLSVRRKAVKPRDVLLRELTRLGLYKEPKTIVVFSHCGESGIGFGRGAFGIDEVLREENVSAREFAEALLESYRHTESLEHVSILLYGCQTGSLLNRIGDHLLRSAKEGNVELKTLPNLYGSAGGSRCDSVRWDLLRAACTDMSVANLCRHEIVSDGKITHGEMFDAIEVRRSRDFRHWLEELTGLKNGYRALSGNKPSGFFYRKPRAFNPVVNVPAIIAPHPVDSAKLFRKFLTSIGREHDINFRALANSKMIRTVY